MKAKTKKTLIIVAAVVAIVLIVWLLFFRKKEWERILDKLDIDETVKSQIRAVCEEWDADTAKRNALKAEAAECGETYDRWLVLMAAAHLKYPVQTNMLGQIIINPKN